MNRIVLAAAVVALAAACGKKSETVSVNAAGGSMTVSTGGSGMALPAEFPKDVPLLKGTVVQAVMGSPEQGNLIVISQIPDSKYAEVFAQFESAVKEQGWSTSAKMDNGQGGMLTLKKEGRDLLVAVSTEGKNVNVQYTLPRAKKG